MSNRFLLYIDILGFAEMTQNDPRKVARVYEILNRMNSHRSDIYKTIVFSDTVLVYNLDEATSDSEREHYVWYLSEFAEHLHHMLTGQDIYFRAILTAGDFNHYKLKNVECFFGEALVNAYNSEKGVPSLGLFIDAECSKYNRFFRLALFSDQLSFVYLCRSLEDFHQLYPGPYPVQLDLPGEDVAPYLPYQVKFLADIFNQKRNHPVPAVRTKFLTAWDFYHRRYGLLLDALVTHKFSMGALTKSGAWLKILLTMNKEIAFYKRIGSGTSLSLAVQGKKKSLSRRKKP